MPLTPSSKTIVRRCSDCQITLTKNVGRRWQCNKCHERRRKRKRTDAPTTSSNFRMKRIKTGDMPSARIDSTSRLNAIPSSNQLAFTLQCTACGSPAISTSFTSTCARCGCKSISSTSYHPPPPPIPPLPTPTAIAPETDPLVQSAVQAIRFNKKRKPFDSLKHTQQYKRKKLATFVLGRLGTPINALRDPSTSANELLKVPTSFRRKLRTTKIVKMANEKRIVAQRLSMAQSHGTSTGTFTEGVGTYLTRPIEFVRNIRRLGQINIGGDAGGGTLKIGIIYSSLQGTHKFIPLLVRKGGDKYDDMMALTTPNLTPFLDESSHFIHIFEVLQFLIDESEDVLLVGDYKFISTVVGHMGASSNHPCFVCVVPKEKLEIKGVIRNRRNNPSSYDRPPLLKISPHRIVPPILHLFLGIANKIIKNVLPNYIDPNLILHQVSMVRTIHTAAGGGLSDLYDLNGSELKKFIKKGCVAKLLVATPQPQPDDVAATFNGSLRLMALPLLQHWLEDLYPLLLDLKPWDNDRIKQLQQLVNEVHSTWSLVTNLPFFPKLHMLHHCVDFVKRHHFLGSASESPIESFHATYNALYDRQHLNSAQDDSTRLRRCLADAASEAMTPFVSFENSKKNQNSSKSRSL